MKIIQSRLQGVPGNIVDSDAVQFASRKVAAVSGDARRALDMCRRAVEIAEMESSFSQNPLLATPSKKRKDDNMTPKEVDKRLGRVMIGTIKQAINEATSSPLQQCLKSLPLSSKLFLAALLARTRRSGLAESILGAVIEEAKRLSHMADNSHFHNFLMTDACSNNQGSVLIRQAKTLTVPRVLGMGAAAVELFEAGVIALEPRKGERIGKVRLNIGEEDVKLALRDDGEVRGLGFSA